MDAFRDGIASDHSVTSDMATTNRHHEKMNATFFICFLQSPDPSTTDPAFMESSSTSHRHTAHSLTRPILLFHSRGRGRGSLRVNSDNRTDLVTSQVAFH